MDEHGAKVFQVFLWTLLIVGVVVFILGVSFGAHAGIAFFISIFISSIIALFVAMIYGASRRGQQIGNIIEAKNTEIKQRRKLVGIEKSPIEILKERYAKGELSKEQYDNMKIDLMD